VKLPRILQDRSLVVPGEACHRQPAEAASAGPAVRRPFQHADRPGRRPKARRFTSLEELRSGAPPGQTASALRAGGVRVKAGLVHQPKCVSTEPARLSVGATATVRWFPLKRHDGRPGRGAAYRLLRIGRERMMKHPVLPAAVRLSEGPRAAPVGHGLSTGCKSGWGAAANAAATAC
jgi:hypothetical protein